MSSVTPNLLPWFRRASFRATATTLLVLASVACGSAGGTEDRPTIGILRAVPGAGGSDGILSLLADEGFVRGSSLEVFGEDTAEAYPDPGEARVAVEAWADAGVDLIIALSSGGAAAAVDAAPDALVVFLVNDPTAVGLIRNERRPEGNLTGVTFRVPADRTLVTAREAIPGLKRIGLLYPSADPAAAPYRDAMTAAARPLGLTLLEQGFGTPEDVPAAIDALVRERVDALLVANAPSAIRARDVIREEAMSHGLPVIANTEFITGALVVIQPDVELLLEQLSRQVVRLLNGAAPADVPVEDPRRFQLIVDESVARALGIALDESLIRQATEVIR